jgi:hypothetical protein
MGPARNGENRGFTRGERGDSNPRPPGPQPGALPAELRPPRVRTDSTNGAVHAARRLARSPMGRAIAWGAPRRRGRIERACWREGRGAPARLRGCILWTRGRFSRRPSRKWIGFATPRDAIRAHDGCCARECCSAHRRGIVTVDVRPVLPHPETTRTRVTHDHSTNVRRAIRDRLACRQRSLRHYRRGLSTSLPRDRRWPVRLRRREWNRCCRNGHRPGTQGPTRSILISPRSPRAASRHRRVDPRKCRPSVPRRRMAFSPPRPPPSQHSRRAQLGRDSHRRGSRPFPTARTDSVDDRVGAASSRRRANRVVLGS